MYFIQVPTTLLSQVDSSVGGKTGINHPLGKNMIGAFQQPQVVLADMAQLKTLPPRELSAGLAEVIKYALLGDVEFLTWLEQHMDALVAGDATLLAEAVYRSCAHKARIVEFFFTRSITEGHGVLSRIIELSNFFSHGESRRFSLSQDMFLVTNLRDLSLDPLTNGR